MITRLTPPAFLVLCKPAGVSMATSGDPLRGDRSEAAVIERLLSACGVTEGQESLFLVHRLDVGTTGVVVLARSAASHRALSLAFQERRVVKRYRALVWGHPVPARGLLESPLGRDREDGRKMAVRKDGKPAVTEYRTLRRYTSLADLELTPKTGRTHQLRVHLSARGHPIAGDDFYGGATRWHGVKDPSVSRLLSQLRHPLLHAESLEAPGLDLKVSAPLPRDYEDVLSALGRPAG
jgi:23S rRNA pseudouridine1911/1915/1917 synthase